jgi:DNA-binding NtrC family response regulator
MPIEDDDGATLFPSAPYEVEDMGRAPDDHDAEGDDGEYDPRDFFRPIPFPLSSEAVEQREITIESYRTSTPFYRKGLLRSLRDSWLTPNAPLGLYEVRRAERRAVHAILGYQREYRLHTFDYPKRRPLFFSFPYEIQELKGVRYTPDAKGNLSITTFGGGREITERRLEEFHSLRNVVPSDAVIKRNFDRDRLRQLCFARFGDRLFKLRFKNPSATEYQSIETAEFQGVRARPMDPDSGRLREVREDPAVKVESFESCVELRSPHLEHPVSIRFRIAGDAGSLRLSIPKLPYRAALATDRAKIGAFYQIVEQALNEVLDQDYYAVEPIPATEAESVWEMPLFTGVDLTPFRSELGSDEARERFLGGLELADGGSSSFIRLRALDQMLVEDKTIAGVDVGLTSLLARDPRQVVRLLRWAQSSGLAQLAGRAAGVLFDHSNGLPADIVHEAHEDLFEWALQNEQDGWDLDCNSGEIRLRGMRFTLDDLRLDVLSQVLGKLLTVLHARLLRSGADKAADLRRLRWCTSVGRTLSPHSPELPSSLRLLAMKRVPRQVADGNELLEAPVADEAELDREVLRQFGLPLWPCLSVKREGDVILLENDGEGALTSGTMEPASKGGASIELAPGASLRIACPADATAITVRFPKFGVVHEVALDLADLVGVGEVSPPAPPLRAASARAKVIAQRREWRKVIDPDDLVIGGSPALLELFEQIHFANQADDPTHVLLLGESGAGKTHISELIHRSSERQAHSFRVATAGATGGDTTLQRGEWVGYGPGHGIQGIERSGREGHIGRAHEGTLFVDEFACLSSQLQEIFLPVLEGQQVQKVGGFNFVPDVRCVFATNANTDELVQRGALRGDLLARITIQIKIPPLRERRGDIPMIARRLVADGASISPRCMLALLRHDWPRNIRELANVLGTAMGRKRGLRSKQLEVEHLSLPSALVAGLPNRGACRAQLWREVFGIAQCEGWDRGAGLQRRVAEIMGVGESQVSRILRKLKLVRES